MRFYGKKINFLQWIYEIQRHGQFINSERVKRHNPLWLNSVNHMNWNSNGA